MIKLFFIFFGISFSISAWANFGTDSNVAKTSMTSAIDAGSCDIKDATQSCPAKGVVHRSERQFNPAAAKNLVGGLLENGTVRQPTQGGDTGRGDGG